MLKNLETAERILIPKGDDNAPCVFSFQERSGVEVPTFKGEKLEATSGGRTFYLVKGRDVPELIAKGFGDIGLTGSDSFAEARPGLLRQGLYPDAERIGPAMCRFALLAKKEDVEKAQERISGGLYPKPLQQAVTSYPTFLTMLASSREMNVVPANIRLTGSIETMLSLTGLLLAADLVASERTARENGLGVVGNLADIYPEVVFANSRKYLMSDDERYTATAYGTVDLSPEATRSREAEQEVKARERKERYQAWLEERNRFEGQGDDSKQTLKDYLRGWRAQQERQSESNPEGYSFADVGLIDRTFELRRDQINDLSVDSYTLRRMRDSNRAGKKAGEEVAEASMAIFGDGTVSDCEAEIADTVYAQMTAAYSKDKPVRLENILQTLIDRNRKAS